MLGLYYAKDHISILSKFGLTLVIVLFFIIIDFFIVYASWKIDVSKDNAQQAMDKLKSKTLEKYDSLLKPAGR